MSSEHEFDLFDWERVLLACRLSSTAKLVGFILRTTAANDGSGVFPGTARVCVLSGLSYAAVKRARAELKKAGLIALVRQGNRRAGRSDEYRLTVAEDLLDRAEILNPTEIKDRAEQIEAERRGQDRSRKAESGLTQSPTDGPSETPDNTPQGSHRALEQVSGLTQSGIRALTEPPTDHRNKPWEDEQTITAWQPAPPTRARANRQDQTQSQRAPGCGHCGTYLDPDGTCTHCHTREAIA